MRKLTQVLLIVVATVSAAACSSGDASALTGKDWHLTAITEKTPAYQGVVPAAEQSRYTVTFNTDGTFSAKADCNQVLGTYTTSGSKLTMTLGPSTLVACPEGSFGDLFAHALSNAATYKVADDKLTITLTDEGTLTFTSATGPAPSESAAALSPSAAASASAAPSAGTAPSAKPSSAPSASTAPTAKPSAAPSAKPSAAPSSAPSPGSDLTGKTWQLTAITENSPAFQGVVPAADQPKYTIEFKADGTFQARADCNTVLGTYTATSAGNLTLTMGPSTVVACPDGSLSDLYILGLSNAASYVIATDLLTITLHDQGTLIFK